MNKKMFTGFARKEHYGHDETDRAELWAECMIDSARCDVGDCNSCAKLKEVMDEQAGMENRDDKSAN